MDKYKRLSQEYQTQAKEFKKTHEEIKESEQAKHKDIQQNFQSHFDNIEKQVAEDKKNNTDENGEYEITKENRML